MTDTSCPRSSGPVRTINFHGDQIVTFEHEGRPYVAMRHVVENLRLNWASQRDKLASQAVKYHCTDISTVDAAGRIHPMFAIPISKLALWLASINPIEVPDEAVRDRLELYQAESAIALHDYWTRGFALNEAKLESSDGSLEEAVRELRKLRASDRILYRKVTDAIAKTSYDYAWESENNPKRLRSLFARIQDTTHVAVCGKTSQQLVLENADSSKPLLGMIAFDGDPKKITSRDVRTGKNYLEQNPFRRLENLYEQLFLFAEQHMLRGEHMSLAIWEERLNTLLKANGYESLNLYPSFRAREADVKADEELKKYKARQKLIAA
jgi:hypothetical protein